MAHDTSVSIDLHDIGLSRGHACDAPCQLKLPLDNARPVEADAQRFHACIISTSAAQSMLRDAATYYADRSLELPGCCKPTKEHPILIEHSHDCVLDLLHQGAMFFAAVEAHLAVDALPVVIEDQQAEI